MRVLLSCWFEQTFFNWTHQRNCWDLHTVLWPALAMISYCHPSQHLLMFLYHLNTFRYVNKLALCHIALGMYSWVQCMCQEICILVHESSRSVEVKLNVLIWVILLGTGLSGPSFGLAWIPQCGIFIIIQHSAVWEWVLLLMMFF